MTKDDRLCPDNWSRELDGTQYVRWTAAATISGKAVQPLKLPKARQAGPRPRVAQALPGYRHLLCQILLGERSGPGTGRSTAGGSTLRFDKLVSNPGLAVC